MLPIPLDLAEAFTLLVFCAPGERWRAEGLPDHVPAAMPGIHLILDIYEDEAIPAGTLRVLTPDNPAPWRVLR